MLAAASLVVVAAIAGVARAQSFTGVVVPPVGSVGPIRGTVLDLPPGGAYAVCAYKDSRTSTLWGPLTAPVGAGGAFTIADWAANLWWDAVSPRILLFVTPAAFVCPVSEGLLDLPAAIYDPAVNLADAFFTRVDPMRLDVTRVPAVGDTAASVEARLTGLPEAPATYAAVVLGMVEDGTLAGPLGPAGCRGAPPMHALRSVPGDSTAATVAVAGWVDPGVPPASLLGFYVLVFPAAFVPDGSLCLNASSGALAIPLGFPAIASGFGARELPPSATPSRPPSASAAPSASVSPAAPATAPPIDGQGSPEPEGDVSGEYSAAGDGAAARRTAAAVHVAVGLLAAATVEALRGGAALTAGRGAVRAAARR